MNKSISLYYCTYENTDISYCFFNHSVFKLQENMLILWFNYQICKKSWWSRKKKVQEEVSFWPQNEISLPNIFPNFVKQVLLKQNNTIIILLNVPLCDELLLLFHKLALS